MKALQPPDRLHLQAAQDWCQLHAFAEGEVDNVTASLRAHPKLLEVRLREPLKTAPLRWTPPASS